MVVSINYECNGLKDRVAEAEDSVYNMPATSSLESGSKFKMLS
jgi:hypothetical protein